MANYIIRRLIAAVFIIIIVSLVVFFAMRLLPGDPILMYLGQQQLQTLTEAQIQIARHQFGLDRPLTVQYVDWVSDLIHGKLGTSVSYHEDVAQLLIRRLPLTLHLGLISFILGTILGILAGVISALKRGKVTDLLVTLLANIGITVPIFWLGILMIYVFGYKLSWLPMFGYVSPFENFWLNTKQIIMPIICLSIFTVGAIARQTRSSILEVNRQDYIRTAWAKGLRERAIILKHMLKNGLIPIVTLSGMQLSGILGGAVLIETVFNIPGAGRLSVDAVMSLDYVVVQDVALITAMMVVLANLIVDISYGWLDPRIRYD
jgi:peptide/nickel transport system permease protein